MDQKYNDHNFARSLNVFANLYEYQRNQIKLMIHAKEDTYSVTQSVRFRRLN